MEPEKNVSVSKDALRCACPNCGDTLQYDIENSNMKCRSCGSHIAVETLPDVTKDAEDNKMEMVKYVCPSCGASIHASETAATSYCSYCGADVVLTSSLSRIERPEKIVPFKITRQRCEEIYRHRLEESKFAPDELKAEATIRHFRPIYISFWEYEYEVEGSCGGNGEKSYTEGSTRYEETYTYTAESKVHMSGLLYDASSAFEDETANSLLFETKDAKDFHPAYLSGMYAEAADTGSVVYTEGIRAAAGKVLDEEAERKTGLKGHCTLPEKASVKQHLVMMPVWVLAKKEGGRVLYTAVNGYSGKIVCDPPVSKKKFTFVAAGIAVALAAAIWLLSNVVILRPNLLLAVCAILAAIAMKQIVPATDEILLRREVDVDPTRRMKHFGRSKDGADQAIPEEELDPNNAIRKQQNKKKDSGKTSVLHQVFLGIFGMLGISVIGGIAESMLSSFRWSSFVSLMISDRGILAPIILIIVGIILLRLKYRSRDVIPDPGKTKPGSTDFILLMLMRALIIIGLAGLIIPLPYPAIRNYGLSIVIMALVSYCMIRMNKLNTEFVTRPVPDFGKEEQSNE